MSGDGVGPTARLVTERVEGEVRSRRARATRDNRPPSVDYAALAHELGEIEAGYVRAGQASTPVSGVAVLARGAGPEMRGLSEGRQRLEARLYAAVLKWNTLRSQGITGDPRLAVRALEVANAFWADPKSLVLDGDVADALAVIEASIKDLEARGGSGRPLRVQMLLALREQKYKEDQSSEILRLDLNAFAAESGVSRQSVARRLRDLIDAGLIEPHYPTMGEGPMEGAVRITPAGMQELRRLGEDD